MYTWQLTSKNKWMEYNILFLLDIINLIFYFNQCGLWCSGGTTLSLIRNFVFKPCVWRKFCWKRYFRNKPCNTRSGLIDPLMRTLTSNEKLKKKNYNILFSFGKKKTKQKKTWWMSREWVLSTSYYLISITTTLGNCFFIPFLGFII